jgi:Raf kinase inhibitor-like YbhB/YbcL family protein
VKLLGRVLLAILVLAAAFIAVTFMRASKARDVDQAFHVNIPKTLELRSVSFNAGGDIPVSYSCKGEGVSPQVSWESAPDKAQSFVLIEMDWDGPSPSFRLGSFTHWILYDIPANVREIKSAISASDLSQQHILAGNNSSDVAAYMPSCPPLGKHRYVFRVYALDVAQILPASPDRSAVMEAMQGHVLGFGELVGLFGG